jgi:hypothetical protein
MKTWITAFAVMTERREDGLNHLNPSMEFILSNAEGPRPGSAERLNVLNGSLHD